MATKLIIGGLSVHTTKLSHWKIYPIYNESILRSLPHDCYPIWKSRRKSNVKKSSVKKKAYLVWFQYRYETCGYH